MHKYLSYISPKTILIPTKTCYFAKKRFHFLQKKMIQVFQDIQRRQS